MEVKVFYLCVLLSATFMLLGVYGYLLMVPDNTLRVAVALPLVFPRQHTSIHVGITNEVEDSGREKQYLVTVNNKSASSRLEGTIPVLSEQTSTHLATVVYLTHTLNSAVKRIPPTTENETHDLTKREEHLLSSNQPAAGIEQTTLNPAGTNTVTPPLSHALQTLLLQHPPVTKVTPPTTHAQQTLLLQQHPPVTKVTPPTTYALKTLLLQQHPPVTMVTPPKSHALQYKSQQCSQQYCMEHLSSVEKLVYSKCKKRVPHGVDLSCRCQFVNARGRRVVALVSLPGSGNTWVRGLLERVTRVCTGSIYCDKTLRAEGFCGEGLRSGALLVVKTHDSSLQWKGEHYKTVKADRPFFDAAIFLIRSPFRAAIAEWNREVSNLFARNQNGSSHVKYVDKPQFFGEPVVTFEVVQWIVGQVGEFTLLCLLPSLLCSSSKCRKKSSVEQDPSEPSCEMEIDGQQPSPEAETSSSADSEVRGS